MESQLGGQVATGAVAAGNHEGHGVGRPFLDLHTAFAKHLIRGAGKAQLAHPERIDGHILLGSALGPVNNLTHRVHTVESSLLHGPLVAGRAVAGLTPLAANVHAQGHLVIIGMIQRQGHIPADAFHLAGLDGNRCLQRPQGVIAQQLAVFRTVVGTGLTAVEADTVVVAGCALEEGKLSAGLLFHILTQVADVVSGQNLLIDAAGEAGVCLPVHQDNILGAGADDLDQLHPGVVVAGVTHHTRSPGAKVRAGIRAIGDLVVADEVHPLSGTAADVQAALCPVFHCLAAGLDETLDVLFPEIHNGFHLGLRHGRTGVGMGGGDHDLLFIQTVFLAQHFSCPIAQIPVAADHIGGKQQNGAVICIRKGNAGSIQGVTDLGIEAVLHVAIAGQRHRFLRRNVHATIADLQRFHYFFSSFSISTKLSASSSAVPSGYQRESTS